MIELTFATRELRNLCEDPTAAEAAWGSFLADAVRKRLADLMAATSIWDVVAGAPRGGTAPDGSEMCLQLGNGWELPLVAVHRRLPLTANVLVDWTRVRQMRVHPPRRLPDA